jgi:ABC-2 type transport system permease protein
MLLGAAYVAAGLFFSSMSENQIVAAVLTFGFSLFVLLIGWLTPFVSAGVARVLSELSIVSHIDGFSKGLIDTNDLVYYVNFSALFLFLCSRVLESNRWRG